jgi:hypothetical protein
LVSCVRASSKCAQFSQRKDRFSTRSTPDSRGNLPTAASAHNKRHHEPLRLCGALVPLFSKKFAPLTRKISHSFAFSTFPSQTSEPTTENMLTRREFRPVGKSANAHIYGAIDTQCKPCSQRLCMSRHICMRRAGHAERSPSRAGRITRTPTRFAYWRARTKGLHYIVRSTS